MIRPAEPAIKGYDLHSTWERGLITKPQRALAFIAAITVLLATATGLHASETKWELVEDQDAILVWQKDVPGTSLVKFRGQGLVEADIFTVFAVLYDVENKTDLLNRCSEYQLLGYESSDTLIAYSLLESPFFLISDRDIIFKTSVSFEPTTKRIIASFRKAEDQLKPPPQGVIRAADMSGRWILQATTHGYTNVTYEAMADPSGMIPHWMVNWTSKWLPHQTIKNMRHEVTRSDAYAKSQLLVKYLFDFRGLVPNDHQALTQSAPERTRFERELASLKQMAAMGKRAAAAGIKK